MSEENGGRGLESGPEPGGRRNVDVTGRRWSLHPDACPGREAGVMSTSNGPILVSAIDTPSRGPLRLRMTEHPGRSYLDGGWWPQSRDLSRELADLVDHFPGAFGRIVRAVISP